MKVGILTYQNTLNYGGVLQAYALLTVVRAMGADAELINYFSCPGNHEVVGESYVTLLKPWHRGCLKRWYMRIRFYKYWRQVSRRRKRTQSFLVQHIQQSHEVYPELNDLRSMVKYGTVIVGSDQVWHYKARNCEACLLGYLPSAVTRIAYAVSLGASGIPDEFKGKYVASLPKFASISVRERSSVGVVQELAGSAISVVSTLDPTQLLPKQDWMNLIGQNQGKSREPFVFLYWVGEVDPLRDIFEDLFRAGHRSVRLFFSWEKFALNAKRADFLAFHRLLKEKGVQCRFDGGPLEFVTAIAQSSCVVSDSFHAMMFATIFEKPMSIVIPEKASRADMGNRMLDFASLCGLESVICRDVKAGLAAAKEIDFTRVKGRLEQHRIDSLEFLRENLTKAGAL